MVIGLTGRNGSGKGVVANLIKNKGFEYYSLSDVLRNEIKNQNLDVTRENLIKMGRKLRQEHGAGVLAKKIVSQLQPQKKYIIDSIRHPEEVKILREKMGLKLICVSADQKTRFERCKMRKRESDPTNLEDFIRLENKELKNKENSAQQLIATEELADKIVKNDGSLEDLQKQLDRVLNEL